MRRFGPIAVLLVVVVGIGAFVLTGGDDDGDSGSEESSESAGEVGEGALSFSQAAEEGIEVDWPETCDTETENIAIPSFFAPECYAPFEGDNGGATDTGVTGDTITIAYYQSPPNPITDFITGALTNQDTNEEGQQTLQGYIDLYEDYAETYGRSVELVPVEGSGLPDDDVAARADAVRIDEEIGAFMVWSGPILTDAFADELAARGIPCLSCVLGENNEFYEERAPWLFGISASNAQFQDHFAEWLTKQVAGRPAEHAGDELAGEERVFGLLYLESDEDSAVSADRLEGLLGDGGVELAERVPYQLDPARLQEQASSAIAKLKDAGVTSVIISGDPVAPETFTSEATSQDWFPEWIVGPNSLVDTNAFSRTYDQEQWQHAFGVTPLALRIDPAVQGSNFLYEWYHGEEPPAATNANVISPLASTFYPTLQGAGPNLTREGWSEALRAGEPTPNAISQPSLNWGDDTVWGYTDWLGIDDFTEIWWNPDEQGPDENGLDGTGMWMFVDGGTRYFPGDWPERDTRAFDPDGAVSYAREAPNGEAPPDYPSPAG
ncbi:MAG: ABC transporter substrate-binding protein [Actinomycetota bacterium]